MAPPTGLTPPHPSHHLVHEITISALEDDGKHIKIAVSSQGNRVGKDKKLDISKALQDRWEFKIKSLFEEYINQPLRAEPAN